MVDGTSEAGDTGTTLSRRILIVDDTPENLTILAQVLRHAGYDVVTALSGKRALQVAARTPVALVLLDIRMPEMDGYEVCRRFKESPELAAIPIIFISAATDTEIKVRAFTSGGVDFISKPFETEEVLARVRTHLMLRTVEDILERRLVERTRELATSETRYRNLVEAIHDTYFFYTRNPEHDINYVSQSVTTVLGYDPSEFRTRHIEILKPIPVSDRAAAAVVFEAKHKDGSSRILEVSEYAVPDGHGAVLAIEGIAHDVTEQRRAAAESRRAREAAEAASRAKSAFLATMSHEIRTPITGILGMADLLCDGSFSPQQTDYLNTLVSSANGLLAILNDVLDMSKIEAGTLILECAPFSLPEVVSEIVSKTLETAKAKNLAVKLSIEDGFTTPVWGDPHWVKRVVLSLLDNAIKFTEAGGINISVSQRKWPSGLNEALVEVRDTGIGIAPHHHDLLFQVFSQIDSSFSRQFSGSGLGLASSRHLIEMMGGEIGFDSEPGRGSRFFFTLRLQRPQEHQE